jgi:hypothetical protein
MITPLMLRRQMMKTKYYKLTHENDQTIDSCQWGKNVCVETSGEGNLCGIGWTHWYASPLLAVILNPLHVDHNLTIAHLWEGENGEGGRTKSDRGLKIGLTRGTTIKRLDMPVVSITQKVAFAILTAMQVYKSPAYTVWATSWLSGCDRSFSSAYAAAKAVKSAYAAAKAEYTADTAIIATDAVFAADAVADAYAVADAVANTADTATYADENIDLIALAQEAMKY